MRSVPSINNRTNTQTNLQAGFFRLYLFLIFGVLSIAVAAYVIGKATTSKPVTLQTESGKYYTKDANGNYVYNDNDSTVAPTQKSPYLDSVSDYGGAKYDNSYSNQNQNSGQVQADVQGNNQNQNQTQVDSGTTAIPPGTVNTADTAGNSGVSDRVTTNGGTGTNDQVIANGQSNVIDVNSPTATTETEKFTSAINKKVSFPIEKGSKVKESGMAEKLSFNIKTEAGESYVIYFEKTTAVCSDPVYSFAISPSEGVDYRIIRDQKETAIKSLYRALIINEEYGTYAGAFGIRTNACVFSAVPTRIEIRTSSFDRKSTQAGFTAMGNILNEMKF